MGTSMRDGDDVTVIEAAEPDGAAVVETTVLLDGELPGGCTLRGPIEVVVWLEGSEAVADAPDLSVHAFGADADAALANLATRVVDHVERLEELGERPSPRKRRERDRLRALLYVPDA